MSGFATKFKLMDVNLTDIKIDDWVKHVLTHPKAFSLDDLPAYIDAVKNIHSGIHDRKMLLEKILVVMAVLGDQNDFSTFLQEQVIEILYKDLPHPPSGYLALPDTSAAPISTASAQQTVTYAYRSADGSDYNVFQPSMGKAGTPYARSVPSVSCAPHKSLPDPGLVFDTILRREKFVPHPGGISSLFFGFADLVIHSIFNTDHHPGREHINNASSYLDLSILYGSSEKEVNAVRMMDGTGRLWHDVFADSRLVFMPPSACALLVLLSRNHNYIAEKILNINERGTLKSPPPTDPALCRQQDDEIFHRARLVNCAYFMQIILGDYVGAILGLARDGYSWRLNPLKAARKMNREVSPRGEGNVVSVEFNLLYRWHATLSEQDTKWTEELFRREFFGDKDFNKLTSDDFKMAIAKIARKYHLDDVRNWEFDGLKRGPDGRFSDNDLAKILQDATEWPAGAFQARGCPEVLRVIEILGIEQSRRWGTCSMNEFRKFMGLAPFKDFKEWNRDENVAAAAQALYKHIDNLELHVGLQGEEAKKPGPGAGLCPGFTISRAILSDAVCLTRGDRFLTVEFTPYNFTSWGWQDCQFDAEDGSYGGMLTKLLFRTLPDHYPAQSAYAHFPFLTNSYMRKNMEEKFKDQASKYIWERPPVPKGIVKVDSYTGVEKVLKEQDVFASAYERRKTLLLGKLKVPQIPVRKLLIDESAKWAEYFARSATDLIQSKSVDYVGSTCKYVDIVGDVINMLPVFWIARELVGLPIAENGQKPGDGYDRQQIYKMFADVCEYIFLNAEPVNDWRLRESATATFEAVSKATTTHLASVSGFPISILDAAKHLATSLDKHSHEFLKKLLKIQQDAHAKERAAALFMEVVPTAAHFSQALAHVVNFYLDAEQSRQDIVTWASKGTPEGNAKVMGYVREALRLDPPVSGMYRTATKTAEVNGVPVKAGELVFTSFTKANLDATVFGSDPTVQAYSRSGQQNGVFGIGEYGLLAPELFETIVPSILKTIFSLKELRRAPEESGRFNRFTEDWNGTKKQLYINARGEVVSWPDSLIVQYAV